MNFQVRHNCPAHHSLHEFSPIINRIFDPKESITFVRIGVTFSFLSLESWNFQLLFRTRYDLMSSFHVNILCCYMQGGPYDGPVPHQRGLSNACNKCARCKIWDYSSYIARKFMSLGMCCSWASIFPHFERSFVLP